MNDMSREGWSVLVEGQRDARALRKLGYEGRLATLSAFGRRGAATFQGSQGVVVMTDLDREGAVLAARSVRRLTSDRLVASLAERRRLKAASRGRFLHIENLGRFADSFPD